jgi:hypothetical protein
MATANTSVRMEVRFMAESRSSSSSPADTRIYLGVFALSDLRFSGHRRTLLQASVLAVSEIRPISPNPIPGDQAAVARAAREQDLLDEAARHGRGRRPRTPRRSWWRSWGRRSRSAPETTTEPIASQRPNSSGIDVPPIE